MSREPRRDVPEQVKQVLSYFLGHPQAADSLDGVCRWCLHETAIHRSVDEIELALQWLLSHGYLLAQSRVGVAPVYSLNPGETARAARLLNELRRGNPPEED